MWVNAKNANGMNMRYLYRKGIKKENPILEMKIYRETLYAIPATITSQP
jgi:hypothetical protein